MGGLINSATVKGDLWLIEAGANMSCYPLATTAEGPGPRVGHSSLLVGNAFIVFGGDTKMEEGDILDETLYLLNTCKTPAPFLILTCSLTRSSDEAMVTSTPHRAPSVRPIRTLVEYSRLQDIRLWWPSGGLLHERPCGL